MKKRTRYRIIALLESLAGDVLPLLFWLMIIFGFDTPYIATLTIIAAVIHELGHSVAIMALSRSGYMPMVHVTGFRFKRADTLGYKEEIIILAMGPVFNITAFLLCLPFLSAMEGYIGTFAAVNLITALSNLLPVESYDGYGILRELFTYTENVRMLYLIERLSFFISLSFTFLSLYLIDKFGSGYWIFGIFFFMMLAKLIKFGKTCIFRD